MEDRPSRHPISRSPQACLDEIALAYRDAREALPFSTLTGHPATEDELLHLAPHVFLKFRGLQGDQGILDRATYAALSSYAASAERDGAGLSRPHMAFAFCYLASHLSAGLVTEDVADAVMGCIEAHENRLKDLVERGNTG